MSHTTTMEISMQPIERDPAHEGFVAHPDHILLRQADANDLSTARAALTIATLTGITLVSSFSTGLLTVGLPRMAKDVDLPASLLLWPASVYQYD